MAGDFWLGEDDLDTLARLLRVRESVDTGEPSAVPVPVALHRYELLIGVDEQGRRFLARDPAPRLRAAQLAGPEHSPEPAGEQAAAAPAAATTAAQANTDTGQHAEAPATATPAATAQVTTAQEASVPATTAPVSPPPTAPVSPPPTAPPTSSRLIASPEFVSRWRGCLLAGAVGDALGAPIEGKTMAVVRETYGPAGLTDLAPAYGGLGTITDDTQMLLFTLEGLIRAHVRQRLHGAAELRDVLQHAYQRWLHTQGVPWERARGPKSTVEAPDGELVSHRGLHHRRAPGATCFFALEQFGKTGQPGTFAKPVNDSKGCGGVMRSAPAALWSDDVAEVFRVGAISAALTHGHPSGYLSAGALAVLVHQLLRGAALRDALDVAVAELTGWDGHEEQVNALEQAIDLSRRGAPSPERVAELGHGGVGESALAIAVYAATVVDDPNEALLVSVNHSGDSDSTAAVCGNILGALHGVGAIRQSWLDALEHRDIIERLADDALAEFGAFPPTTPVWYARYPAS